MASRVRIIHKGKGVERALNEIAAKVGRGGKLKVGFLAGATYPDGTSVPLVAAANEFGTEKSPPRPFFRKMVDDNQSLWGPTLAVYLKRSNYDIEFSLDQLGEVIEGELKQSINEFVGAPLSPRTIAAKGFDKQLIDTSFMINSTGHKVDK